jgi:hypothetical protein
MSGVTRKKEVTTIDGTPAKRMFWSIISDYNLKTGLCELVDNAIDLWRQGKQKKPLVVDITLDVDRQLISVVDNAGGVKLDELRLLVAPGGSRNDPNAEIIGIFGVGSKRAGVALGERVEIRTRYRSERSHELEITKDWLKSNDWELPGYEIPDIAPGTTEVHISHLRKTFSQEDVDDIRVHFGETYSKFISDGCVVRANGVPIVAHSFDAWAYPPGQAPRMAKFATQFGADGTLQVEMTGGLIRDRDPERENYGVYFFCNDRLIVKEQKTREVGYFNSTEAGVPHPDASLCRVIVRLTGPAILMPWNSSKSGINFGHAAFQRLRPTLIQLTSHFSSLSRRLKDDWDGKVLRYETGKIDNVTPGDIAAKHPLHLPELPRVNKPRVEKLKSLNKKQIQDMPWTLGLVEAMDAVEVVTRQSYQTKNRIALMLLDSNFEIALKEFIVHRNDLFPPSQFGKTVIQKLFERRDDVIAAIAHKVAIPKTLLIKAQHYYNIRNKLVHERATVEPPDSDIENYRATIEKILRILFKLSF